MPSIEPIKAKNVFDPTTYTQAIKVTGADSLLFLSGQVAYDQSGGVEHVSDFKGQARAAFNAVKALVTAAGGDLSNVIKFTIFVTDMRYRNDYAAVRQEFYPEGFPTSTLVEVSALAHPAWLIEIEAIAVL